MFNCWRCCKYIGISNGPSSRWSEMSTILKTNFVYIWMDGWIWIDMDRNAQANALRVSPMRLISRATCSDLPVARPRAGRNELQRVLISSPPSRRLFSARGSVAERLLRQERGMNLRRGHLDQTSRTTALVPSWRLGLEDIDAAVCIKLVPQILKHCLLRNFKTMIFEKLHFAIREDFPSNFPGTFPESSSGTTERFPETATAFLIFSDQGFQVRRIPSKLRTTMLREASS